MNTGNPRIFPPFYCTSVNSGGITEKTYEDDLIVDCLGLLVN